MSVDLGSLLSRYVLSASARLDGDSLAGRAFANENIIEIETRLGLIDARNWLNNKKSGLRPTPGNLLFQEA